VNPLTRARACRRGAGHPLAEAVIVRTVAVDQKDAEFIKSSVKMLPEWGNQRWWNQFIEISGWSREYLGEKLRWFTGDWPEDNTEACQGVPYVLMFFDNPDLYELLDDVAPTWQARHPGRVGRRWSEEVCAAAWRVLVAAEPDNIYSHNFAVPDSYWQDDAAE
jgi:hypothetical protein